MGVDPFQIPMEDEDDNKIRASWQPDPIETDPAGPGLFI